MLVPRPPTWTLGRSTVVLGGQAAGRPPPPRRTRSRCAGRPSSCSRTASVDEAVRALARGQAHAVGQVEQEDDVLPVHPPRQRGPQRASAPSTTTSAHAHAERPAVAGAGRQRRSARRSGGASRAAPRSPAAPTASDDEQRPQLALQRASARSPPPRARCRAGSGRGSRFDSSASIRLTATRRSPARGRQRVEPDLVGLGEAHRAPGHRRLHRPAAGRRDGRRGDAVRDGQQDRLPGRQLQARLVERGRVQPAQRVGQDQRERDPQREVGLEQVEADDDRLAVRLLERVDERAAHRLHQRPARPPAAACRMASSMATLANSTWRITGCARSQSMIVGLLEPAQHLDRHVGRHRVDEDEAAGAHLRAASPSPARPRRPRPCRPGTDRASSRPAPPGDRS